jgi:hypothetical protein
VLAPLNAVGDTEGCRLENGVVRTPTGFKDAFDQMKAPAAGPRSTRPRNMAARACPI